MDYRPLPGVHQCRAGAVERELKSAGKDASEYGCKLTGREKIRGEHKCSKMKKISTESIRQAC